MDYLHFGTHRTDQFFATACILFQIFFWQGSELQILPELFAVGSLQTLSNDTKSTHDQAKEKIHILPTK